MHTRHAGVDAFNIGIVLKHWGDYGDWYVLNKIQKNTDYDTFGIFVKMLVEKVKVEEETEDEARGKKAKKDLMNDDYTTEPDEEIKALHTVTRNLVVRRILLISGMGLHNLLKSPIYLVPR